MERSINPLFNVHERYNEMHIINPFRFAFTPADIATELWCDASDANSVTLVSGYVSQLNDKSGNSRHFTQTTADNRPSYQSAVQNSLNVIRFDGSNDFLGVPSSTSMFNFLHYSNNTVFIVTKLGNSSNPDVTYCILDNCGAGANVGYNFRYDDRSSLSRNNSTVAAIYRGYIDYVSKQILLNSITPNQFNILVHIVKPAASPVSDRSEVIINGTPITKTNTDSGTPVSGDTSYNLILFAQSNGALNRALGDFCELIICSSALSTDTLQKVEGYLAHKWGLTSLLPVDHPWKTYPPGK